MATIKKKVIGKQTYYYLDHSIRKNGRVEKRQLYLGKKIPKDIEKIKRKFLHDIYDEKWYSLLARIKEGFAKESGLMSKSSKEKEMQTFMIKFTYDSQRIEGSRLTLRETANLLERGVTPRDRSIRDVKEAEAHKELFYEILRYKKDLVLQLILEWHRKLFQDTKLEITGKIRKHQVAISGSRFMPPSPVEVYPMMREFLKWYDKSKDKLNAVELAALVHLKFVTVHPFADGNGRISRLMMNFVLNRKGYPMLNIPYEGRNSYYNALEKAQVKNMESIFVEWLMKRYIKEYGRYLKGQYGANL